MNGRTIVGALVAVASLSIPVTSARACHFFDHCCGRGTTAYYAPVAAAPACCPQPQVVNYMPQTCYRTVYVNQPVVSYCPTTACDACGRATTVMRPVTTYVRAARLVPYTTYRPVATTVARPCCGQAPMTTYYAPPVQVAPAAPCCTSVSARSYTPLPAAATYSPAPVASPVPAGPSGTLRSVTPVPSLNPAPPSPAPEQTFETSPLDSNQPQSRLLLPPTGDSSSSTLGRPRGLDPQQDQDRSTAIPLRRGTAVRQASLVTPAAAEAPQADDGWRAGK
jgi:hypothetical protein